ncbi:MAG: hypothetical protein GC181_15795 [Bacteroidetes bacterium]|nr:hypothetical protein [Bacteroidota bacterium]
MLKMHFSPNSIGIKRCPYRDLGWMYYYPFGMGITETGYAAPEGGYRFGFNGKEDDNEISNNGNQCDYGFRIFNPRIGRFLSVDPLFRTYPWYSPYQFTGNCPIKFIDVDGREREQSPISYGLGVTIPLMSSWKDSKKQIKLTCYTAMNFPILEDKSSFETLGGVRLKTTFSPYNEVKFNGVQFQFSIKTGTPVENSPGLTPANASINSNFIINLTPNKIEVSGEINVDVKSTASEEEPEEVEIAEEHAEGVEPVNCEEGCEQSAPEEQNEYSGDLEVTVGVTYSKEDGEKTVEKSADVNVKKSGTPNFAKKPDVLPRNTTILDSH